jgi:hypothetical protein
MNLFENEFLNPPISPYAKCPNCRTLMRVNFNFLVAGNDILIKDQNDLEKAREFSGKCANCRAEFTLEEIAPSLIENVKTTSAVSAANTQTTFDVAVFIFFGTMLIRLWIDFPFLFTLITIVPWFFPLFAGFSWFLRYGELKTDDADYLSARKSLKFSLLLWSAANALNLLLLNFGGWIKFN